MDEKKQQKIHTYKEYREKYGKKFDSGKLEFVSLKDTSKLNKKKKYWKIEDKNPGYYEVSKKPWLIPVIVIGSVAAITAAVVPAVLLTRPQPKPEPNIEYCDVSFEATDCIFKTGDETFKEKTFTFVKGTQPTQTFEVYTEEDEYILPEDDGGVPYVMTYTRTDNHHATLSFNRKIESDHLFVNIVAHTVGKYSFTFVDKGEKDGNPSCTLDNATSYDPNAEIVLTLTPSENFAVPKHISVRIGEIIQEEDVDYEYEVDETNNKATLSLIVIDEVTVEALAPEKHDDLNLALEFTVKPEEGKNSLGFVFQCTPDSFIDPHPENKQIFVDWGDGITVNFNAPHCIDDDIAPGGVESGEGMFGYVYYMMTQGQKPPALPNTDDFERHIYSSDWYGKDIPVKIYGDINGIAFGFPYPKDVSTVIPWGTANENITSMTTYCDFPAVHINSVAGMIPQLGIDFDTYVVLSNETKLTSVNFALGTTKIPNGCCCKARGITSVDIQDTVKEIGDNAFCEAGLTEISIPDSVTKIGFDAFKSWSDGTGTSPTQLTNGVIFGEHPSLKEIGFGAFTKCGFETFNLPDSVETICDFEEHSGTPTGAFEKCASLKTFNIGADTKLTSIGSEAFEDCTSLSTFNLPNTLTTIHSNAFAGSALTSIAIPKNVNNIEGNPFINCTSLASITVNSENAYYKDEGINAIITKQQVGDVGPNTLVSGCKVTTIPDDVTSIGAYAFASCTNMPYIVIKDNIESIGEAAFDDWINTQSIYFPDCENESVIEDKYGSDWRGHCQAEIIPGQYPPSVF